MSATELHIEVETEHQRVARWRVEELERAGYDPGAAVLLAASAEVDLHRAIDLIRRGCPTDLAIQILV